MAKSRFLLEDRTTPRSVEPPRPTNGGVQHVQVVAVPSQVRCPCCGFSFRPGESGSELPFPHGKKGKLMITRIKELLNERQRNEDGSFTYRYDVVAEAFVKACESGSFYHLRELIDRIDGRVPSRIGNADGENLKGYIALPLEGPDAP
jgi:hypothetical protein